MADIVMHWILTVQWSSWQGALTVSTRSDSITVEGRTRGQLLRAIHDEVTRELQVRPENTSILFFSLEPDQIEGA